MDQEYFEDKVVTLKTLTGYQRLREVFGLALLVIAIYLIIALFSFDQADASFSQTALNEPVRNVGGRFGAWLADVLFSVFGLVAYLLPFILLIHCWNVFKQRHLSVELDYFTLALKVIGFLALVLSTCGLADLNFDDWYNFASGGILGSLMSYAAVPMFGHTGATLVLLFIGAIGFTLFTGWSWLVIAEKIGIATVSLITFILNRVRKDEADRGEEQVTESRISHEKPPAYDDVLLANTISANDNEASSEESEAFYVPENQLKLDLDSLHHEQTSVELTKANIEFVSQYPTIETEPTINLAPSANEEKNEAPLTVSVDNITPVEQDRISQIIHSMSHHAQPELTHSVADESLTVSAFPVEKTLSDANHGVIQPNNVENILVQPSQTIEPHDDLETQFIHQQPTQAQADAQTFNPDTSNSVTIAQSTIAQSRIEPQTAKPQTVEQKPVFIPAANRKPAPELPRPNPVRIPTRRELVTQGLRLSPVKAQQYREDESKTAYGDKENEALLHRQFMEQQQARYGEEYLHDYANESESSFAQNNVESIDLTPASQQVTEQSPIMANEPVTISVEQHHDILAEQKDYHSASVNELLDQLEKQLLDEPRSPEPDFSAVEAQQRIEPQQSYANTTPVQHVVEPQSAPFSPASSIDNKLIENKSVENTMTFEPVADVIQPTVISQSAISQTPISQTPVSQPIISQTTAQQASVQPTVVTNPVANNSVLANQPVETIKNEEPESTLDDSLIHPFLMRNDVPLHKPTTPLPTLDLLTSPPESVEPVDMEELERTARLIEERLSDYRVKANVVGILPGPVVTLYELDLAPGVKAARISNLSRDLARALSAVAVRVVEVIPGRPYVGLELPNKRRQTVYVREVLDCQKFREMASPLATVLGKDISGEPVVADLAKMPHVLVAGTTGSGKSVGVNAMIISMLYKATPDEVRFIMIDPKMLELSVYEGIPHLLTEVVTDMKDASNALRWCVGEMERRYKLMSALGVRNLAGYNERIQQAIDMGRPVPDPFWKPTDSMDMNCPTLEKLPYIVVIVDEFADLMMAVGKKVEELIARLAQKARAAGIHLVLATQRPSVDVITGLIKANIPSRIAFTVSSKIDSRTILDQGGAESLLGMGDMLYLGPNSSTPVRVHGAFVRDEEVHAVAQDWKARGKPQYIDSITSSADEGEGSFGLDGDEELDPLFDQAVAFVVEKRKSSISGVQRQFRIGYNRAARIVEQMEAQGIVSPPGHNGNREVLAPPPHDL